MKAKEKKAGFKLPHLMFLILGMLIFMSLMTYVIPAGSYGVKADGTLDGSSFSLLGHQTPVSPWRAMLTILTGLQNSAYTISILLINGGTIGVILKTKAIDRLIDFALYKLQDKGIVIVVPLVVFMLGLLGAFGGGDHLVALIPLGIMMARKLRVDPIMAMGLTLFAVFMGSSWSPTSLIIHWTMMELPFYSGFSVRFVMMLVTIAVNCILTTVYALRVSRDPSKSLLGTTDWVNDLENTDQNALKAAALDPKDVIITILFFLQFALIVIGMSVFGLERGIQPAIMIINCVICGLLAGWTTDEIGNAFAKGCGGMAFVCVIIGIANAMSLVMTQGNILHTIVYYACLPLKSLSSGFAAVGISVVVTFINLFIPSASAKAAILFPIIRPMCEALGLTAQVGIQAFQIGDQFTNAISPVLGMTMAGCAAAGVPFDKYFRFAIRNIIPLWLIAQCTLYVLASMGWTGL